MKTIEEAGGRRARSGREKVNEHVKLLSVSSSCIGFVYYHWKLFPTVLLGKINL